jgi:glutaredoxin 3
MTMPAAKRVNPALIHGRTCAVEPTVLHRRPWFGPAENPPFDRKIHREFPETTLSNPIITIYSTAICPYCVAAKNFLKSKGLSWNEIRIDIDPAEREKMVAKARRTSVPQIFVGDTHVGGYDDMMALHRAGKLEPLLAGA